LQLSEAVTDPVGETPRNFTPAKVHAMKATATPTASITPWNSRVIKYSAPTTGDQQAFYSAPISAPEAIVTYNKIDERATALFTTVKNSLGTGEAANYARFYVTPEEYTNSKA
jgi:hypothetical protein